MKLAWLGLAGLGWTRAWVARWSIVCSGNDALCAFIIRMRGPEGLIRLLAVEVMWGRVGRMERRVELLDRQQVPSRPGRPIYGMPTVFLLSAYCLPSSLG